MWLWTLGLARATTWTVPVDGTVSAVYAVAVDDDEIVLPAGVVTDEMPANLDKRITFRGQGVGNTILELPDRDPSVFVHVNTTFVDLTIDGLERRQMFELTATAVLTLTDVVLQGGFAPFEGGGCVQARDGTTVSATNATFRGCSAATGGAMSFLGSTLVCDGCVFEGNTATSGYAGGGAIALDGDATATLTDGRFVENVTEGSAGGAILLDSTASLTVNGALFDGNTADGAGGAIVARNGNTLTIGPSATEGTTFIHGSASEGGAVACTGFTSCELTVTGATFEDDTADVGGHVYVQLGTVTVTDSTFRTGHAVEGNGGAIVVITDGSTLTAVDSVFELNFAGDRGGAIYTDRARVDLLRVNLCDNQAADSGGGAYLEVGPTMSVRNAAVIRNIAVDSGGGIRFNGVATVGYSTFVQNSATSDGSAIGVRGTSVEIYGSVFSEQQNTLAVSPSPDAEEATMAIERSATWSNGAGDYDASAVATNGIALTADPFPLLGGGCETPIPVYGGELLDQGDDLDLDGTQSDLGATGGPDADPALWASDGDPVPAMWDCDPDSPLAWPGNEEIVGDGIDNDCLNGDAPLETTDTGDTDVPVDTGGPGGTDTSVDPTTATPGVRTPDLTSSPPDRTGCACDTSSSGGWAVLVLAAVARRSRRRR